MSRTVVTALKAAAGVAVLAILLFTVSNWLGDYRTQAEKAAVTTSTPSPAAEEGSGSSADASGGTVVVLVDDLSLRSEPSGDAKTVQTLNKDDKVELVKQEGKWYEVKTPSGKTGWVSASPSYTRVEGE